MEKTWVEMPLHYLRFIAKSILQMEMNVDKLMRLLSN